MSIRGFSCLITFSVIATVAAGAIPPRQWSRPTGLSYDACVATNGDVFVTGTFDGTVDFGDTTVTSAGSRDIVVARYDEDGNTVWVRTAGDSGMFTPFNNAQGVVSTPDGGCVVSGEFYQELAFDSTHVLTTPGGDGFVARYAADGSVMWATSDSISGGYFEGAASDNTGGCYTLSTYFDEEAHVVLTRHDNTGNPRWLLDGTDGLAEAIANDPDGNVVIAGYASASLTLGDSTFLSTTGRNFLAKVDSAGQVLWMRKYGDGVSASDIVVDSTGTIYVCGSFFLSADIGDTTLVQNSLYFDGFLARHDADGNFEWAREIDAAGTIDEAEILDLAVTPEGNVVATARYFKAVIVEGDTLHGTPGQGGGVLLEYASDGTLIDYLNTGSGQGAESNPRPVAVNANGTVYHYSINDTLSGPNLVGYRDLASAARAPVATAPVELLPNFPNPFNPRTTVSFRLRAAADIELVVFDIGGHRVRTLAIGHRGAGIHHETWDGTSDGGSTVASGVYVVRLRAGRGVASRKIVLIK